MSRHAPQGIVMDRRSDGAEVERPRNIGLELCDPAWSHTPEIPTAHPLPIIEKRPLLLIFPLNHPEPSAELRRLNPGGEERLFEQSHSDRNFRTCVVR